MRYFQGAGFFSAMCECVGCGCVSSEKVVRKRHSVTNLLFLIFLHRRVASSVNLFCPTPLPLTTIIPQPSTFTNLFVFVYLRFSTPHTTYYVLPLNLSAHSQHFDHFLEQPPPNLALSRYSPFRFLSVFKNMLNNRPVFPHFHFSVLT